MLYFLFFACAIKSLQPPPSLVEVDRWRSKIDWQQAEKEAGQVLGAYLQVDTINPPGNERKGANYLASVLAKEGITAEIMEFEPGRANLMARLKGDGSEKPLCLLSHIDVVTYEAEKWKRPALSGELDADGYIWGRGALDMKGMGVMELMTMIWLKRLNVPLKRDLILLAVADEEVGGKGIQELVAKHWERIGCSHLVNEGGVGLKDAFFSGQTVYTISTGEKGNIWLKMKASGLAGHGSTPRPNEAPVRLITAIQKLQKRKIVVKPSPEIRQLLANVGHQRGGVAGFVAQRPFWSDKIIIPKLMKNPLTRAALINTVHLTGLGGANKPNVVPSEVYALLDCRIQPEVEPQVFLAKLQKIVGSDIQFEVLNMQAGNRSPIDDPLYRALSRYAVEGESNAVAGPVVSVGFTDSIYVRPKGVHAYGFMPVVLSEEDFMGFHGANEKMSLTNLGSGLRKLFSTVVEVSAKP